MNLTPPDEGFAWVHEAWGPVLTCLPLLEIAPHGFTTRQLDLTTHEPGATTGWDHLAASMGVTSTRLVRPRQVHGVAFIVVPRDRPERPGERVLGDADIVLTDDPDTTVAVQVADCVPLLVADPRSGAVAAAHAGWRGTAAGIALETVASMRSVFGADPGELMAAIGPSIGPCCYHVGEEIVEAFRQAGHTPRNLAQWFSRDGGLRLDLWKANRDQLEAAGVRADRTHVAGLCTSTHRDLFHSYRRDGPAAGRMAAAIRPGG